MTFIVKDETNKVITQSDSLNFSIPNLKSNHTYSNWSISNDNTSIKLKDFQTTYQPTQSIIMIPSEISLVKGVQYQVQPQIVPDNSNDLINYSSDNSNIATVDNKGLVQTVNQGQCKILLQSGQATAYLIVHVSENS